MLFCLFAKTFFPIALLLVFTNSVYGWGQDGHALVAGIAQTLLTDESTTFVRNHLPADVNGNMSKVASWPDMILYPGTDPDYWNWQWSKELHYVNTKDWACVYDRQKDCNWTTGRRCVDGAIQNYTKRLADSQLDVIQRQEALLFLIHFVGDVHQPLHGGFEGDRGGKSILGRFCGRNTNLYSLWDTGMIQRKISADFQSKPALYLDYLLKQFSSRYAQNVSDWTQCSVPDESSYLACSTQWIEEDAELNCKVVYRDEDDQQVTPSTGFDLCQTYYNTRIDVVELRLIQAGVRLATVINKIVQSTANHKKPVATCSTTMLLMLILVIQSALILILLIYSILRRKTTIVVQVPAYGEKKEHLFLA